MVSKNANPSPRPTGPKGLHRASGVVADASEGTEKPTAKPVPRTRTRNPKPEGPLKRKQAQASEKVPSASQLRRAAHKEQLEQRIVEVARQTLVEQGSEALTLREVAAAVGYSHASIYSFFADKQALLARLAAEAQLSLLEALQAQAASITTDAAERREPLLALGRVLACQLRWALAHPHLYRLTMDEALAAELDEAPLLRVLRPLLQAAGHHGAAGEAALQTLWAAVHGAALLALGPQAGPDLETRIEALQRFCLAALRG